jgi:predicted RecA/RadA family phage recombinase
MPLVTFVQAGDAIDYTPTALVDAGAVVVLNDLVGVTKRKIHANELGALHVAGVFEFPKATGTGTAIDAGKLVYWNATAQQATLTASGNKLVGKAVATAGDSAATVRVRMSQ